MHLCTLVLGIWLLPKVNTLKCYECVPSASGSCTETIKDCPSHSDQCGAFKFVSYAAQSKIVDMNFKTCASAQECFDGSVNFGISRTALASKCCTSDNCNNKHVPDISKSPPNGKKCFSCDGQTCGDVLKCVGNEDHCIKTTMTAGQQKVTLKGCASKQVCSGGANSQMAQALGAAFSCCQGDLCNSGSSARAGLLLLLVPLISLVLCS